MYKKLFYPHPVLILVLILFLIFINFTMSNSQILTEGSFEYDYYQPEAINPDFCDPGPCSEITRCLSLWYLEPDRTNFYEDVTIPTAFDVGWYSPTKATADYYKTCSDNQVWYVKTPHNRFTNYDASPYVVRQPQHPHGYILNGTNENARAYTGMQMTRQFDSEGICITTYSGTKNEYIQKKLSQPLQPGHTYRVEFYVSKAYGGSSAEENNWCWFKRNAIRAYFTSESLLVSNIAPIVIQNPNANLHLTQYFDEGNDELEFGGNGAVDDKGTHWYPMKGYVTVLPNESQLNYITIGNFKDAWNTDDINIIPNNQILYLYYFVDDISITEDTRPYSCYPNENNGGGFVVSTKKVLKTIGDDQCCVDIYIEPLLNYFTPEADKVEIYLNDLGQEHYQGVYENNGPLVKGVETKIYQLCMNKGTTHSFLLKFYYDGNQQPLCHRYFDINFDCKCGCDDVQNPSDKFLVYFDNYSKNNGHCCWDLRVKNISDCEIALSSVKLITDNSKVELTDSHSQNWTTTTGGYIWQNGANSLNTNTDIVIGTFCIDEGYVNVDYSFSYEVKNEEDDIIQCQAPASWSGELGCLCCDVFEVYATVRPCPPGMNCLSCCYNIYIKANVVNTCNLTHIKIFNADNSNELFNGDIPNPSLNGDYITYICFGLIYGFPQTLNLKFEMSNSYGIICDTKTLQLFCGGGGGGRILPNEKNNESQLDNVNNISGLTVYPNPAEDAATINFILNNSCTSKMMLYNSLGQAISVIYEGDSKTGFNSYKLSCANLTPGFYFIRLVAGSSNKYIPLTIIK